MNGPLERQHRCNDFDLTFRSEKSLISHMTLHDPGRPLQCSRCSLRYKNKDALGTIHILREHFYSTKLISRSPHRTTNFPNSEYFVCLLFY